MPVQLQYPGQAMFFSTACADLSYEWSGVFGKLNRTLGKRTYVDNPRQAGEKRCEKKNFFRGAFALYFAVLTAGKIPITGK